MSNANVHVRAGDVQSRFGQGFVGQAILRRLCDTLLNRSPQAKQVTTIAIGGATNDTVYSVTIDGVTSSYTADGSATVAEIGDGLVAAIEANAAAYGRMVPSFSSPTLTLTGRYPGVSYTVTKADGSTGDLGSPATATSAAAAARVNVGRAIVCSGYSTDPGMSGVKLGHVPTTADFNAQVITITVDGASGDSFVPQVKLNGKVYTGDAVEWHTSATQTAADIATEMNGILPSETVLVANSSGAVSFTAEVEGAEFEADIITGVSGEATKAYTTGPSIDTSFARKWRQGGVSLYRADLEHSSVGGDDPAYGPNEGVEVLRDGEVWVQTGETITYDDEAYVSLASATKGRFYNSAGTDRVWLPPEMARWERPTRSGTSYSTDVAALRVNLL